MITTVFIDYDGTLHDSDSILHRSLDGILGFSGKDFLKTWIFDIHRGLVHKRYMEKHDDMIFHCKLMFRQLNRPFDHDTANLICRKFDEAGQKAREDPIYFPDAIPALEEMRGMGLKICLTTGTDAEIKAETLVRTTGTNYFEHTFSEPAIGHFKTETEYYETTLEKAGSRPDETVSIGDTPLSDIRPAKLVGIRTIWLNRRCEPIPVSVDQRADHQVADLLQAVELLRNWVKSPDDRQALQM